MIPKFPHWTLLLICIWILTACAPSTTVVLVPNPDGSTGQASVANRQGQVVLDSAYAAATVTDAKSAPVGPVAYDKSTAARTFSDAISALPEKPIHILLYFKKDATALTADSTGKIGQIMAVIAKRHSTHISVVGHTDTAGDKAHNIRLSSRRAQAVKDLLIGKGIDPENIRATSHGEENPLIKTADNVNEPVNRRVEVIVR